MNVYEFFATIICSVLTSSGLWALIIGLKEKKDYKAQMLLGLGHDRIMELGTEYIERGCITKDEYENLHDYLYLPYSQMGGNGSAKRIMNEVEKLPLKKETN